MFINRRYSSSKMFAYFSFKTANKSNLSDLVTHDQSFRRKKRKKEINWLFNDKTVKTFLQFSIRRSPINFIFHSNDLSVGNTYQTRFFPAFCALVSSLNDARSSRCTLSQRLAHLSRTLFIRYYLRPLASNARREHFSRAFREFISTASKFQGIYKERSTLYQGLCTSPEGFLSFVSLCTCQGVSLSSIGPWLCCRNVLERFAWRSGWETEIENLAIRVSSFLIVHKEFPESPRENGDLLFLFFWTIVFKTKEWPCE